MKKITVAMSSYNHGKFVGAAIESVLSQNGCDLEFIIVDDGSSDNTVEEIRKFKDPRIRFIPLERNLGACVALRKAVEEGSGEYVAIINSDDCFLPNKLKKQISFLDSNPHISAVFGYPQFINNAGQLLGEKQHYGNLFKQPNRTRFEWLNYFFFKQNVLCHPTVLIRRDCYQTLGYYDPRFSKLPDFDFWVRLLLKHEIYVMPEELIQFRLLSNRSNASAPTIESVNRFHWELVHILKHYLSIATIEEYLQIFPEESSYVTHNDPELIPFYLANLALRQNSAETSNYRFFAMEVLYKLLEEPRLKEKLEHAFDYRYADFLKQPGLHSIFQTNSSAPVVFLKWLKNSLKQKCSKALYG